MTTITSYTASPASNTVAKVTLEKLNEQNNQGEKENASASEKSDTRKSDTGNIDTRKLDSKPQGALETKELAKSFNSTSELAQDADSSIQSSSAKSNQLSGSETTAGMENLLASLQSALNQNIGSSSEADNTPSVDASSQVGTVNTAISVSPEEAISPNASASTSTGGNASGNNEAADTNQDSKVSVAEANAYAESKLQNQQQATNAYDKGVALSKADIAAAMQAYALGFDVIRQISTSA